MPRHAIPEREQARVWGSTGGLQGGAPLGRPAERPAQEAQQEPSLGAEAVHQGAGGDLELGGDIGQREAHDAESADGPGRALEELGVR